MEFKYFYEWGQLPKNSEELFSQAEKESLFFSSRWFENLSATTLLSDQRLLLACVVEKCATEDRSVHQDHLLAVLPLVSCDNKEWTSLNHTYTSLYTLILATTRQKEILDCLAQGLSQLPFDKLTMESIAADDQNMENLQSAMKSYGVNCMLYAQFFNWFHPLKGQSFAEYMDARPSRVRNTIARKKRKLKRDHGYQIRLYTGDDVPNAMQDHYTVYQSSWKKNEQFKAVVDGFIRSFSALGWVRLAILTVDGQAIATQIWFVVHKKASIFKLAYDEAWKQYSPGSILTGYMMEYVIDTDGVKEIDFLIGNDRYKQDWMSECRQRWKAVYTHQSKPVRRPNTVIELLKRGFKRN